MTMEYTHVTNVVSLLQAAAAGLAMGIYYDFFRILRRIKRFDRFSVAIQDIFFWISAAIGLFFICIRLNNGFIRIYFVVFSLGGWGIYYLTVGKLIFTVFDYLFKALRKNIYKTKSLLSSIFDKNHTTKSRYS